MAKIMDKYWYVSPIKVLCLEEEGFVVAIQRGDIVTGVLHKGDTNATSTLEVKSTGHWNIHGKVELPINRFKKFDIDHAYMEE